MILQELVKHYDVLVNDPSCEIARVGYTTVKVSYALILSLGGELLDLQDIRIDGDKKPYPRQMNVPEQTKSSVNIVPNYLCHNSTYVFGIDAKGKKERSIKAFNAFRDLHLDLLSNMNTPETNALCTFLTNWDPVKDEEHPLILQYREDLDKGVNLVIRIDSQSEYLHDIPHIKIAWQRALQSKSGDIKSMCLVTGDYTDIARLHDNIKGLEGAGSFGAALVSFNDGVYESYCKEKSYNAPTGKYAAYAYVTLLNYLVNSHEHTLKIGDTTMVIWAEGSNDGMREQIFKAFCNPNEKNKSEEKLADDETTMMLRSTISRIKQGLDVSHLNVDFNSKFFILGLGASKSRAVVKYWKVDTLDHLIRCITQHHIDMEIVKNSQEYEKYAEFHSIKAILMDLMPQKEDKHIAPVLLSQLTQSVITGNIYPKSVFSNTIIRIKADGDINPIRVGMIKAYLKRYARTYKTEKEEEFTVALNPDNPNLGYNLGRAFAILEHAQISSTETKPNTTIKDRFFGSASARPQAVFTQLIKLSTHHFATLAKNKPGLGVILEKELESILSKVTVFPNSLTLEDQGRFILGYYHQREARAKQNDNDQNTDIENE